MKGRNYLVLILALMILLIPIATNNFRFLLFGLGEVVDSESVDYVLRVSLETIALITTTIIMIVLLLRSNLEETLFKVICAYTIILGFCLVILLSLR